MGATAATTAPLSEEAEAGRARGGSVIGGRRAPMRDGGGRASSVYVRVGDDGETEEWDAVDDGARGGGESASGGEEWKGGVLFGPGTHGLDKRGVVAAHAAVAIPTAGTGKL